MKTITVTVDDLDHDAIRQAIAVRQGWRILPDGEGDLAGRLLAEVCRGWLEMVEAKGEERR